MVFQKLKKIAYLILISGKLIEAQLASSVLQFTRPELLYLMLLLSSLRVLKLLSISIRPIQARSQDLEKGGGAILKE